MNELNIDLGPGQTGLAIRAKVIFGATQVGGDVTLAESETLPGYYSGNMPAAAPGLYNVRFLQSTTIKGTGTIAWSGAEEISLNDLSTFDAGSDAVQLTALPSIPNNWLTAAGLAGDAVSEIQAAATAALTAYDPPTRAEASSDKAEIITEIGLGGGGSGGGISVNDLRNAIGLSAANLDAQLAALPTLTELEARTLLAANYFDPSVDTVARVTLVDTTTTLSNPTGGIGGGDDSATIYGYFTTAGRADAFKSTGFATPGDIPAGDIAAIKAKTDNLPAVPADQSLLLTAIDTRLAAADYVAPLVAAQVQEATTDALVAYAPPTRAEAAADKAEVIAAITSNSGGGGDATLANQQIILDRLTAARASHLDAIEGIEVMIERLHKRQGLAAGVSTTIRNAEPSQPGSLTTSDGTISQTLVRNSNGSVTVSNA